MAKKNMGHYEGIVEDIDTSSEKFKQLDKRHQWLILLEQERLELKGKLDLCNEHIKEIKDNLKEEAFNNQLDWTWVYNRKRTNVRWKEEFIRHLGSGKAEEVANQYKTKEYPTIGIQYIDAIPDSIKQIKANPPKFVRKHKLKSY
jgi:t-SNARE complex subunit (syntaxin)